MSIKKTHEEYINELSIKNKNVKCIDNYINASTPIKHLCVIHNIEWNTTPDRALSGVGCPVCKKEKFRKSMLKTNEQYKRELLNIHPNIELIEEYIDNKTKIKHHCIICDYCWSSLPNNVLKSKFGCPLCGKNSSVILRSKTNDDYLLELKQKNIGIIPLEKYKTANTKILHMCNICGRQYMVAPADVLSNRGCSKCSGVCKLTTDEYKEKLYIATNGTISVVDEYVNALTKIKHKCNIHNVVWLSSPHNILNGCGCEKCGNEKIGSKLRKTHEQYESELKEIHKNIIPLETYINAVTPILHQCLLDGCEWNVSPANLLYRSQCPKCSNRESKGENIICNWLNKNNIKYIRQKRFNDCKDIKTLPFDFYLPTFNKCIEYDGEQHDKPVDFFGGLDGFKNRQYHDSIKTEYCKVNDIPLLRISYNKNIEEELSNFLFK